MIPINGINHQNDQRDGGQAASSVQEQFDTNRAQIRACCCNVLEFSMVIAIIESISLFAALFGTAATYFAMASSDTPGGLFTQSHAGLSLIGSLLAFVVGSIVIGLLIYGLIYEKPAFLAPHLIIQFLAILGLAVVVPLFVYDLVYGTYMTTAIITQPMSSGSSGYSTGKTGEVVYGAIVVGLCALAWVVEIYFSIVICRACSYLRAKRETRCNITPMVQLVMPTTFPGEHSLTNDRFLVERYNRRGSS